MAACNRFARSPTGSLREMQQGLDLRTPIILEQRVDVTPEINRHLGALFSNDQYVVLALQLDEIADLEHNVAAAPIDLAG
jgi:hypothetical protein